MNHNSNNPASTHRSIQSQNKREPKFRDLTSTSVLLTILFVINIFITLLLLYYNNLTAHYIHQASREVISDSVFNQINAYETSVIHAEYLLFITTSFLIVTLLTWLYKANFNVRQLGAKDLKHTPILAISWLFAPLINIWKAFHILQELLNASFSPTEPIKQRNTMIIHAWWFTFFISIVSFHCFLYHYIGWDDTYYLNVSNWGAIGEITFYTNLFSLCYLALCSISIYIINQIERDQYMHYEAYKNRAVVA